MPEAALFGGYLRACLDACRTCSQCRAVMPHPKTHSMSGLGMPFPKYDNAIVCSWSATCHVRDAPIWNGEKLSAFSVVKPSRADASFSDADISLTGSCGVTEFDHFFTTGRYREDATFTEGRACHANKTSGGWTLQHMQPGLTEVGPPSKRGLTAEIVTACARRCAECSSCHYISVSLYQNDCSWFSKCDVVSEDRAYASFRVRRDASWELLHTSQEP